MVRGAPTAPGSRVGVTGVTDVSMGEGGSGLRGERAAMLIVGERERFRMWVSVDETEERREEKTWRRQ